MMSFHTSRKALSWSAAGKVGFFPVLMKTDHLVSLCTIWLQNNGPPYWPSSGLCTVGGVPCRECCPFSVPKVQKSTRKKAFQQRLLNGEQSGMTESHVQGKFFSVAETNFDFSPSRCCNWIWTCRIPITNWWNPDGCPRTRRVCEMSFRKKKKIVFLLLIFPCQEIQICLLVAAGLFKAPFQQPWCSCCSGTATQKKHYHHFHWHKKTLMMVMKCVFIRRRESEREK